MKEKKQQFNKKYFKCNNRRAAVVGVRRNQIGKILSCLVVRNYYLWTSNLIILTNCWSANLCVSMGSIGKQTFCKISRLRIIEFLIKRESEVIVKQKKQFHVCKINQLINIGLQSYWDSVHNKHLLSLKSLIEFLGRHVNAFIVFFLFKSQLIPLRSISWTHLEMLIQFRRVIGRNAAINKLNVKRCARRRRLILGERMQLR